MTAGHATVYETLMKRGLLSARKLYTEEAIRAAARQYKLWLPSVLVDIDCDKCGRPFAQKGAWTRHVRSCKGIQAFAAAAAERRARQLQRDLRQLQFDEVLAQREKNERERRKQLRERLKELDRQRERARKKELERHARERQEDRERLRREQLKRLQREQREQARREQREQARRAHEVELAQQKLAAEEREIGPRRNLWARNDSETRELRYTQCDSPDGHLCIDLERPKLLDAIEDLGEPYSEWTSSVFDELLSVAQSGPMNRTLRAQLDELDAQLLQLHGAEGVRQLRVNRTHALPVDDADWRGELIYLMVGGL